MPTLYTNGSIFTAVRGQGLAEAMVVEGDRIAFVGSAEAAARAAGDGARVVDLEGRTLMPGLHDAHTHLLASGLKYTVEQRLAPFATPGEIVGELSAAVPPASLAAGEWIVGGEVFPPAAGGERLTRAQLDEAYPDNPVFLYDYSIHHGVVNSRALEAADVHDSDEFGHGGRYVRDDHGHITGELIEEATWKVLRAIPDRAPEVYRSALAWAVGTCHRLGITSVQEASASPQALAAYRALDEAGELNLRVAAHLVWRNEGFGMAASDELDRLLDAPEEWASEHVDTGFVKVWMDGAPLPPVATHAGLTADGEVDDTWLLVQEDELFEVIRRADLRGRTVKVHCAAEGSVRVFLNALARVREANGPGMPHEIAHAGFVDEADYSRIDALDATAEMSPALWHIPEYGLGHGFKFSQMLGNGVRMTIGSDWIITPDPNLFPGVQGAVQHTTHPIPLTAALEAVTRVGAEAVGRGAERGTLEAGKKADFIVLDRDLFGVPENEIGGAIVRETHVNGIRVHALDA